MNVDTQVGKVAGYSLLDRSSILSMSIVLSLWYFVQPVGPTMSPSQWIQEAVA
jgi:hypothetical protein